MKGLILAAGQGTRLRPVTYVVDKALLPIYNAPVIKYVVDTLIASGIDQIALVLNSNNIASFKTILGHIFPSRKFTFILKDHSLGMPFSILQAKAWTEKESFIVIPGDNYFDGNFKDEVLCFTSGATAFQRKVDDPSRFGVAVYKNGKLTDIVEKPTVPLSDLAITAPYLFDSHAHHYIETLKPSARGELEITDLLKIYFRQKSLNLVSKDTYWKDIGTFDSLLEAGLYIKQKNNP